MLILAQAFGYHIVSILVREHGTCYAKCLQRTSAFKLIFFVISIQNPLPSTNVASTRGFQGSEKHKQLTCLPSGGVPNGVGWYTLRRVPFRLLLLLFPKIVSILAHLTILHFSENNPRFLGAHFRVKNHMSVQHLCSASCHLYPPTYKTALKI